MGGQYRDGDAGGDRGTHAKQQEAARKEAAARKAPQDAAADAKGAGEPASIRDAADLHRLALLKDRRSRRIRHVAPRRRGDGARGEEREPAARYSSRNQASRNTSA